MKFPPFPGSFPCVRSPPESRTISHSGKPNPTFAKRYTMIDPNKETIETLKDAAKTIPRRRAGKKAHVSCLYRWTSTGCRGVILESIQIGATRCTSREALARFFAALTHANPTRANLPPARNKSAVEAKLEQAGL